ncbi:curculin (mannose-binding) lectin [Burkholderia territorii]|uniref:curculin (mannose-binding) lectin n=1 Tax=Burkholderia territorii TaxID=1503055 RepID=UPI0009C0700F|nr:curculin (mannose-binding) lectin [Burkholderia territorii]
MRFVNALIVCMAILFPMFSSAKILGSNETLTAGNVVYSDNGQYHLAMQTDGNLVLYGPTGAVWQSQTSGSGGNRVVMQGDGNLVVYRADNKAVWSSKTSHPSAFLAVQDDGNVAIYWPRPVWSSNTSDPATQQSAESKYLASGSTISAGQTFTVAQYMLVFQADGNLVLYKNGGNPIWATYTQGKGATHAAMQADGNFVIYAGAAALWSTKTAGANGAQLVLQSDGNLVIYAPTAAWSTKFGLVTAPAPRSGNSGPGSGICVGTCPSHPLNGNPFSPVGVGTTGLGFPTPGYPGAAF